MTLPALPDGVIVTPLTPRRDDRGTLVELFRAEWPVGTTPRQWNAVTSEADVLRGLHVHAEHEDYLTLVHGRMLLGLKDARRAAATAGLAAMIELDARAPVAVTIPTGVGHAFYFPVPATLVYGLSHGWTTADELGCRWDDPDLGLDFPTRTPRLSERDRAAGSYAAMVAGYEAAAAALAAGRP